MLDNLTTPGQLGPRPCGKSHEGKHPKARPPCFNGASRLVEGADFRHVSRKRSLRFAALGIGWCGLFHLWQEAKFLGANGRRTPDDRGVVFCQFRFADVPDLPNAHHAHLRPAETGVLIGDAATVIRAVTNLLARDNPPRSIIPP